MALKVTDKLSVYTLSLTWGTATTLADLLSSIGTFAIETVVLIFDCNFLEAFRSNHLKAFF